MQHSPVNPVLVEEAKADRICGAKNDSRSKQPPKMKQEDSGNCAVNHNCDICSKLQLLHMLVVLSE